MENPFLYLISIFIGTLLGVLLGQWISGAKKISFKFKFPIIIKGVAKCVAGIAVFFIIKNFSINEFKWTNFAGLVAIFYFFYSGTYNFIYGILIFSKKR